VLFAPGVHAASAPAFSASPSNLTLYAKVGGAPPAHQAIVVNNTVADSTLKWRASVSGSGAAYCAVNPNQGSITGGSAVLLTVSASVPTSGGIYQCTITLSDNGSTPKATNTGTVSAGYGVLGQSETLPPPDTTPPTVPSYLSVTATGLSTVNFNWYPSGEPGGYVAGYVVYRDGHSIAVTGLTSYQDSGLATSSYHTYTVTAFGSNGYVSAQAPPMSVTTYAAVPAGVPPTYQSLYQGIESNMSTDFALINAQWAGTKYPVKYSSSLMSADENAGLRTSFTNLTAVNQELDGLQALGINAALVEVGFPIFDQNFWEFIGQSASQAHQTVQNYLTFYELVAQDVHGRKGSNGKPMILIVEANPLLTVDDPADSLNASGYYQSLSFETYEERRSANTVTIAQNLKPDFLTIQSEPDTDANNCYRPELNTPATDVAMVQSIANNLAAADVPGLHTTIKVDSGMGAWQENWQEYLGSPGAGSGLLGISELDDIDNHVLYLTGQASSGLARELGTSMQMIQMAQAAGKTASIGQYWAHKSLLANEDNLDVLVRDTFSFWAPLDQQFIPIIFQLANRGSLQFLSSINDGQFWAYEPYATLPCLPVYPASGAENVACDITIQNAEFAAVGVALALGQDSSTGAAYKAAIAQYSPAE
jgi:hypothetical protein